jgi:arsenate reductase
MSKVTLYGIPNCDTVKKAQTYLKDNEIPYTFHNFKTEGISDKKLKEWFHALGFNKVINKVSASYKKLEDKSPLEQEETALDLVQANTSIIKRPVLEWGDKKLIGYKKEEYDALFLQ